MGVAWARAYFTDLFESGHRALTASEAAAYWFRIAPFHWPDLHEHYAFESNEWGARRVGILHGERRHYMQIEEYGWPAPSLSCRWYSEPECKWTTGAWWLGGECLPLRPLWPGIVSNTVVYFAAFWLLFLGPGMLKRMLRRYRGRCPVCGYDLRGTTHERCPECGNSIRRAESVAGACG